MALAATTVFEVDIATGSDTNGGGFNSAASGLDYSYSTYQTTFSYTDVVIGATTTQGTSVNRPFVANDVGNILNFTSGSGFNLGRFQIVSVSAGIATFDSSLGTTASTGGTGTLGGSLASPSIATSAMVGTGNRIWIKTGTYTISSASTNTSGGCCIFTGGGSASAPCMVTGYNTTRGDILPGGLTRPTIVANGVITSFTLVSPSVNAVYLSNIIVDGNSRTSSTGISNGGQSFQCYNVKVQNCTADSMASSGYGAAWWCEFTNTKAPRNMEFFNCYSHNNISTSGGFNVSSNGGVCVNCIAANNPGTTGHGFTLAGSAKVFNCVSYGNSGNGFQFTSNNAAYMTVNCVATNNTGIGFNGSAALGNAILQGCATYNNTGGATANITATIPGTTLPITLSGDPFTNAAGGDFSLNNTVGAGASLRAAGVPGNYPGLSTTTGYPDIGAAQHVDPSGMIMSRVFTGF